MRLRGVPAEKRFWYDVRSIGAGSDDCWEWAGYRHPRGYGRFVANGKGFQAHRYAYEQVVGPIPDGMQIDHLCRNRACVNPVHLEPVSNRTNSLRGEGPTAENARKTECIRGHALTPDNVYVIPSTGSRACRRCGIERTIAWRKKRQAQVTAAEAAALTAAGYGAYIS